MNIEAALKLKTTKDLLRAAQEAEARNCELSVINTLYARYYEAVAREQRASWVKERQQTSYGAAR